MKTVIYQYTARQNDLSSVILYAFAMLQVVHVKELR